MDQINKIINRLVHIVWYTYNNSFLAQRSQDISTLINAQICTCTFVLYLNFKKYAVFKTIELWTIVTHLNLGNTNRYTLSYYTSMLRIYLCYVRYRLCCRAQVFSTTIKYFSLWWQKHVGTHDHVSNLVCYYKCVKTKNVNH